MHDASLSCLKIGKDPGDHRWEKGGTKDILIPAYIVAPVITLSESNSADAS